MLRKPAHLRAEHRILAVLVCVAIGLCVWQDRAKVAGGRSWPEGAAQSALGPLQVGFVRVAAAVSDATGSVARAGSMAREKRALQDQVDKLQTDNARLHEYFRLYKAMSEQLGLDNGEDVDGCPAAVVSHSSGNWTHQIDIMVSAGRQIAPGDVVLAGGALVGHVTRTDGGGRRGTVRLLLDEQSYVYAMNQRSRYKGMLHGPGPGAGDQNLLRMDYVSKEADFRVHDTIATSGLGGIYPKGLRVGEVVSVGRCLPSDVSRSATIKPAADFGRLEYVIVLRR
jgi:rod shape-determining protein MreC